VEFTDEELIQLYEIAGFKLGDNFEEKLKIVTLLRGFHKERFEKVMQDLVVRQQDLGTSIVDINSAINSVNKGGISYVNNE
jgi:hypothetical protein